MGAHTETIAIDKFKAYLNQVPVKELDIMLEVKDKNRSAEKMQIYLDHDIHAAQSLWARYKYHVLAKSAKIYQNIRELLNDRSNFEPATFIRLLEEADALDVDIGAEVNAGQHVWGYFKDQASKNEKQQFQEKVDQLQNGELTIKDFRRFLKRKLKKYPNDYLERSLYFD